MILLKQKLKFNAPIEHVYSCCTDISYFQKELVRQAEAEEFKGKVKVRYKDKPFEEGSEIIILSKKKTLLKIIILKNIQNNLIKTSIIPYAPLIRIFGETVAEARFSTDNSVTVIDVEIEEAKRSFFSIFR